MRKPQDIIATIRDDVLKFQKELKQKMIALYEEGLLTDRDRMKIESNMGATLDALSKAVNDTVHHDTFREDWILSIVSNYHDEIIKLIKDIESRRYTDKFIVARIEGIKQRAFSQFSSSRTDRKGLVDVEIAKLEKQLWEDIHGVSSKHSRRPQLIEAWLQEFESNIQSLLRPRLNN